MNTWYAVSRIGAMAAEAWPTHPGAAGISQRGSDLGNRCDALSMAQFATSGLTDTVRRLRDHLRDGSHPVEAYGFALDQIERAIITAEQKA